MPSNKLLTIFFKAIVPLGVLDAWCPNAVARVAAIASKACTGECKAVKPLDKFGKQKTGKLGRESKCKDCKSAYDAKRNARPAAKARQKKRDDERKTDPVRHAAHLKHQCEYDARKRATPEGLVEKRCGNRIVDAKRDLGFTWGPLGQDLPRNAAGCDESTFKLLGIVSWAFYAVYLKETIYGGMVWLAFQIDHIRPLSSFDLNDPEQRKQAFHYTNTRLLTAEDNMKKGDKWSEDTHPKEWNDDEWVLKEDWELIDENDKYGLNKYQRKGAPDAAPAAKRRKTGIETYFNTK